MHDAPLPRNCTLKETIMVTLTNELAAPRPEWLSKIMRTYTNGEAHAFLLYGPGVNDCDASSTSLHGNLYHIFGSKSVENKPSRFDFDIVVRYDRNLGFRFLGYSEKIIKDRELFKSLVEGAKSDVESGSISSIRGGPSSIQSPAAAKSDILDRAKSPAQALRLLNEALTQAEVRLCVILDEIQTLCPRGDWATIGENTINAILALSAWGLDFENVGGLGRQFSKKRGGHIIVGVCSDKSEVHPKISMGSSQSGWVPINVGFPNPAEREFYIRQSVLTEKYLQRVSIDFGSESANEDPAAWLAGATGGLSIRAIEDIRLNGDRHRILDRSMVQHRINRSISEQFEGQGGSDYLQVINPTHGLRDYGFPDYLVEYIEWFVRQFRAKKLRNANILEVGPPGTGKSILAYAIAHELGFKCVHWSPALTQSKWVGDSEKQLMQVLNWVEANLPCMMFVDEIDVALTSRDGGSIDTSGVGSKMLSILMPWLEKEEVKGNLLLVGATNRADNIDAAMRRRLQTVIPVLPPVTLEDRRAVLENVLVREQGIDMAQVEVPDEVVADGATKWYTQANLSILAEKAASIASRKDESFSDNVAEYLRHAVRSYRVDTVRTENLSYLAASQASDTDLLPPGFQIKQQAEIKQILKDETEYDNVGPLQRVIR